MELCQLRLFMAWLLAVSMDRMARRTGGSAWRVRWLAVSMDRTGGGCRMCRRVRWWRRCCAAFRLAVERDRLPFRRRCRAWRVRVIGRVDGSNGRRVPDVSACSMVAAFATSRRDGRAAGRGGCGRLAVPIDQTGGDAARDRSGGGAGVTVWHGAACSMVAAMLRGVPSGGRT